MEWNTDLDLALRSLPWTPLRCSDSAAEDRLFLAKFLVSAAADDPSLLPGRSCCLLLFDAESGQAFFEPLRTSRILKRCAHLELNAIRIPDIESTSTAAAAAAAAESLGSTGTSQDDSEARLAAIFSRLERVFSLTRLGQDSPESTSFLIQGSRYAATLEIRSRSKDDSALDFSFSFEADSLDHEQASSVFLNHFALPLLGVGSAMQRLLCSPPNISKEHLLPDMQQAIGRSAVSAQQDHRQPFLDVFSSPFLSTALTRWSETHLRREQPRAVLTSFAEPEAVQNRRVVQTVEDGRQRAHQTAPPSETSLPPKARSSSRESASPPPPATPSSTTAPPNKRPSPSDHEAANPSPSKRHRNDVVNPQDGSREEDTDSGTEADETASDRTGPDENDFSIDVPEVRSARAVDDPMAAAPPSPAASMIPSPARRTADDEPGPELAEPSSSHVSSGISTASPLKAGPPPSRTILAPLRKGAAPARGTARSRRF
ncbi:unnamed protein product [Tilletia controversa]|nr:unnamed protein product [Tilletia controversa]